MCCYKVLNILYTVLLNDVMHALFANLSYVFLSLKEDCKARPDRIAMASFPLADDLCREICYGSLQTVKAVKKKLKTNSAIDVNAEDSRGRTALAMACLFENKELVEFLLKEGANPNLMASNEQKSPLMVACQKGYKDIAEVLIEHGANVNSKCEYYERTALHYACMMTHDSYEFDFYDYDLGLYEVMQRERNKEVLKKSSCIKLLIEHGAVYQTDALGLTPICYAGMSRMDKELLPSFAQGSRDPLFGYEERIRGLEFRGMSYAIYDQIDIGCAYSSFLEAKQLEQQHGYPPMYSAGDGLSLCFGREECRTVAELKKLKGNKDALLTEGYLVGGRIIPKEIAPEHLWKQLLEYPTNKLAKGKDFAQCQRILCFLAQLHLAPETLLDSASVLESLCWAVHKVGHKPEMIGIVDCVLQSVSDAVDKLDVKKYGPSYIQTLCKIAMNASVCRGEDLLHATFPQIEGLIMQIYLKMKINTRQRRYRVCASYEFFDALFEGIHIHISAKRPSKKCVKKLKRVMARLLHLDNAAYTTSEGETILHLLAAQKALLEDWYDVIVSMTEMVIRRGCPVEAQNHEGLTAKEKLNTNIYGEVSDAKLSTMLALLSEQSSVLRLEELAARSVLKWKIPYTNVVPITLQKFLE